MADPLVVTPRIVIPAAELAWTAVRASGPGGQNVNKVASKVELRFDLPGSEALPPAVKARLARLAGNKLDADGCILITSQATRDQRQNLEDARDKLAELVRRALVPPKRRRPTRPTRASQKRRVDQKRKHSEKKQARGRVRRDD